MIDSFIKDQGSIPPVAAAQSGGLNIVSTEKKKRMALRSLWPRMDCLYAHEPH
ncbi:hypothetical protein [Nitrosomonas sp. Nm51]|uniref:hypothetical protein n=1 Tax=Nitrosomonas sp. Nm51 TaxID=133720 RepID=UPI00210EBC0D|nr:hypothetical protein [Nitrosomonas sp. Nm51]